jgi:HEAT repeat protein
MQGRGVGFQGGWQMTPRAERPLEFSPAEAWLPQDPADSLYRVARQLMSRSQWRNAAETFRLMSQRYPASGYTSEAMYYQAWSLYRIGGENELKAAHDLLTRQKQRFPTAANPDPGLITRIEGQLASRGDPRFRRSVATQAANQGQACNRDDMTVRLEALNALNRMSADSTAPILRRILTRRDECSITLRRQAITLMASTSDAATTDVLIDVMKNDPALDVRRAAISWLGDSPSDRGIAALEELLRSPNDAPLHSAALRAITSRRSPRAAQALRSVIERTDASDQLRGEAMSLLIRADSAGAGPFLRALYPRLTSPDLKRKALDAIARTKGEENESWLLAFVRNPTEPVDVRRGILSTLARSSTTTPAEVGGLYAAVPELELKQQIITSLASRKEPEAVDQLIAIYRASTDSRLRVQIINVLSRRNDPRTKALLLEIINK